MLSAMVTMSATVMTVWLLFDASRKRVDFYWYLIILTPLGEWIYFFAVKIHDYDLRRVKKLLAFERPPPVDEMRRAVDETPSMENKIRLGQALYDAKEYVEAAAFFNEALDHDDEDKEALYGIGLCRVNQRDFATAVEHLAQLVELSPTYADYEPWFDLAYAHWEASNKKNAVEVLEALVRTAPRIKHKAILGKYLMRCGHSDRARVMLDDAVHDYQNSAGYIRRTCGRWAAEARDTLEELRRNEK